MSKKHWFGFHIFVLMFSSAGILFFHLLSIAAPFITIPSLPKEMLYLGVATGYGIAISLALISIYAIWKMITKVTIVPPKEIIPLDKTEFSKLCDEIKETNIGQSLMNHVMECEDCKKKSLELNQQATKHIDEREKLI